MICLRVKTDIKELDSLQKIKYFEETKNIKPVKEGQIVFMQDQKTQLLYPDIQSLYARKQLLETESILYPGVVTLLGDFSSPALQNIGMRYYSRLVLPVFFAATLFVLIIMANRKKLLEVFKKY